MPEILPHQTLFALESAKVILREKSFKGENQKKDWLLSERVIDFI